MKNKKILKLLLVQILISPIQLHSQNLVENPSFESSNVCAINISNFKSNVYDWSIPSLGTTDLFNSCSNQDTGVPNNFNGYQNSKFGENYAGCYFYADDNYREYIQGSFKNPLEKGKKYNISFYISLGDKSKFALKNIEFLLTSNLIMTSTHNELSKEELKNLWTSNSSYHKIERKGYYDNMDDWTLVSKEIIAKGGESFITIGNFEKNSATKKTKVTKTKIHNTSYYYIDMVSVKPVNYKNVLKNKIDTVSVQNKKDTIHQAISLNKNYVIKNITFKSNSIQLSELAKSELNDIYNYLNSNENIKITIIGHTDSQGTKEFNQILSSNRAKSVAKHLISMGINKDKVKTIGYGNSQPISTNKTKKGRDKNRRVEFRMSTF